MPIGLVIMKWDERIGVTILANYPEELTIQERTLMQLYSQHEFTGEAGLVTLTAGPTNLASYYAGRESGIYVILVLTSEEDGDVYEEGLAEMSRQIIMSIDPATLKPMLPPIFQRLSVYPTLNEEQSLAMAFNSEVKRLILKRLREETTVSKSELAIWLKDHYKEGFIDIENIVSSLVKLGLVKISSVKGVSSDMLFLIQDIMISRTPPTNLIKDPVGRHLPESLAASYLTEVKNFFQAYQREESDSLNVIEKVILDPACYEALKLMREAIVTRNDVEKLRKKGVDDVDLVFKKFWEAKMIAVFKDEKDVEYYCLVSDFFVGRFFPEYTLDIIRNQYRTSAQNPNALLKGLDLLKEEYYSFSKIKKAASKKEKAKETKVSSE